MSLEVTIYDDEDKPIEIMGYLIKGQSGMRDIYGVQETPDDEDEIEIVYYAIIMSMFTFF